MTENTTNLTMKKIRSSRTWGDTDNRISPVIAITGGIGSGKSVCSAWMARHDIPVVDADIVNACLLDTNRECQEEIIALFGEDALDSRGGINRDVIAEAIFSNADLRRQLEQILHPRIMRDIRRQIQEWRHMGAPYILLVIPLLPTTQHQEWPIDWAVFIESTRENRIKRLQDRRKISIEQVNAIFDAQSSDEDYRSVVDEVIENDGDLEGFRAKLDELHERLVVKF